MSTVTFQPSGAVGKDTLIRSGASAGNNYGNIGTVAAGLQTTIDRGLIEFTELLTTIPAGATILSAILTIRTGSTQPNTTAYNIGVHRSLVAWFEGSKSGSAPDAGQDGSTWNLRNANGSVAWAGGAGGASGSDWVATATDVESVSTGNTAYSWDVTADVQNFVNGTHQNYGWWLISQSEGVADSRKSFSDSGNATPANRPALVVEYRDPIVGSTSGSCTVTGTLSAIGTLAGSSAGIATASAILLTNEFGQGSASGTSTASARLSARWYMQGVSFGDSTAIADIKASYHSQGSAAGTSSHVANIKGIFRMQGSASGQGTLIATPSFQGQLRGTASGSTSTEAVGYARAVGKATEVGCNPVPLFYITDGSVKENGQLNILNFLGERNGYLLKNYRPPINQYKDGGRWSSSPQSQGRRFQGRQFDNAIDILELSLTAFDQDTVIDFQQELLAFQEAAADYWSSEYPLLPIYLVARAARERNTRYAIIHMISCPELENPYAQPFFSHQGAAFENLTVRIERGLWWSTPPGRLDCVETSGQREWTVSGWQAGS